MIKHFISAVVGVGLFLCGCNSIYFYETEKVALNVEGRPDGTRPVSGTFGASMHVAAVVPPKKANEPDEAMSLISYFNLEKDDADSFNPFDDPLTIETVLITGDAQRNLKDQAPGVFTGLAEAKQKAKMEIDLATKNLKLRKLRAQYNQLIEKDLKVEVTLSDGTKTKNAEEYADDLANKLVEGETADNIMFHGPVDKAEEIVEELKRRVEE
ncbi:MAG: hypothetical protein ACYS67_03625 [Planctomycetota bacterium]|jgi:hypothetical protein